MSRLRVALRGYARRDVSPGCSRAFARRGDGRFARGVGHGVRTIRHIAGKLTGLSSGSQYAVVMAVNAQGVISGLSSVGPGGSYSLSVKPGVYVVIGEAATASGHPMDATGHRRVCARVAASTSARHCARTERARRRTSRPTTRPRGSRLSQARRCPTAPSSRSSRPDRR